MRWGQISDEGSTHFGHWGWDSKKPRALERKVRVPRIRWGEVRKPRAEVVQLPILGTEDREVHIPMAEMRKIDLQYSELKRRVSRNV
jgi:hypothetical protein